MDKHEAKSFVEHHLAQFVGMDMNLPENKAKISGVLNSLISTMRKKNFIVTSDSFPPLHLIGIDYDHNSNCLISVYQGVR